VSGKTWECLDRGGFGSVRSAQVLAQDRVGVDVKQVGFGRLSHAEEVRETGRLRGRSYVFG